MKNTPDIFRRGSLAFTDSPLREMLRMQRRMDRFFDEGFMPTVDIAETEQGFSLSFDLPGLRKDDIHIDLNDSSVLTVSGERREESKDQGKEGAYSERFYGTFSRSFTLPQGVKPEQIQASYSDGVLRLTIPKSQVSEKSRRIQISEGVKAGKAA